MSKLHLNAIVTRALLDQQFGSDILNGHRKDRLSEFDLTAQERADVLAIHASDLDTFIRHVEDRIRASDWRSHVRNGGLRAMVVPR